QVGNELLRQNAGKKEHGLEEMPMDFCVAETQGSIGYFIELSMLNELRNAGMERNVITILTPVIVDAEDKAFQNPTKPVGPYYKKEEVEKLSGAGAVYKEDAKGNGWRKVVASPVPQEILHSELVKQQAENGTIVVTVGGGGIPVTQQNNTLKGVEAVIDKDLASALLGNKISADELYILTDVPNAYINFRQENEKALGKITLAEAKRYLDEGHFKDGSMAPKIKAAIKFVENGGKKCVITCVGNLKDSEAGTQIIA
ncbi:MAG: carbamate kinase, partial [Bacteroidales bacterium]|nr:carbamate kinase [Bacteroidales bacterium]